MAELVKKPLSAYFANFKNEKKDKGKKNKLLKKKKLIANLWNINMILWVFLLSEIVELVKEGRGPLSVWLENLSSFKAALMKYSYPQAHKKQQRIQLSDGRKAPQSLIYIYIFFSFFVSSFDF